MKTLILTLALVTLSSAAHAYDVNCTAYDTQTSATIFGSCLDGMFTGYNDQDGSYISGTCEAGGAVSAQDEKTGAFVNGFCDPAPPLPIQ